jgi:hypothetical protein
VAHVSTRAGRIARRTVAIVLIVLGCFLTPVTIASLWVHHTVIDPTGYVDTVAPLASRPAIQQGIAKRTADGVTDLVDGSRLTDELPPAAARRLQPVLEEAIHALVERLALQIVESDQFQNLWRGLNERAHQQVVDLLTGDGAVKVEGDEVVLDLEPLIKREIRQIRELGIPGVTGERLEQRLEDRPTEFVLLDNPVPGAVQTILRTLDHLAYVLPFIVLALFGLAIWLFPNHRRGVMWIGIAVAFTMSIHVAAVGIGRRIYLDVISGTSINEEAASDVYVALTQYLRNLFIGVLVVSLLVALIAFLAGRQTIRNLTTHLGPVEDYIAAHTRGLQIAVVILGFLVFVLLREPSWFGLIFVVALVIALVIALEAIARARRSQASDDTAAPTPSA